MKHPPRPNVFQRLARTWDAVHPYNAGQACRVAGEWDPASVVRAWGDATRSLDLANGSDDVQFLAPADDLGRHFTAGLNQPFDVAAGHGFRPFVQAADGSTWLGLVYQHRIADSASIRLLLREWVARLTGVGTQPTDAHAASTRRVPSAGLRDVLELFRRFGEYRRVRKVHTMGPLDYPVRVLLLETRPIVPALLAYARANRVKLNDVFLAALAAACDRLVPTQARPGRDRLAVSTVVDLRDRPATAETFGCRLGFRSAVCRADDLRDWPRLLRAVAGQRSPSAGGLWMRAAEVATRFSAPARLYDFYRKEAPFAAGVSNVDLRGSWFDREHPARVLDYVRVSPTGPMVPLAMNVTTLGDDLHLSMTYRTALLNDWTAREVAQTFAARLARIISNGGTGGGEPQRHSGTEDNAPGRG